MCERPKGHVTQLFIPLVKSTWEKQIIAHAYAVISSDQGLEAKKVFISGESRKQGVVAAEFGTTEKCVLRSTIQATASKISTGSLINCYSYNK